MIINSKFFSSFYFSSFSGDLGVSFVNTKMPRKDKKPPSKY